MSPHAVNTFVSDLVQMAQAMEQLPQVQAELDRTKRELEQVRQSVQDRELRIIDLKTEIDTVTTKLNAAEVARDDAELRFLELDERANDVVKDMRRIQEALGSHILSLDPPKAQEPKPIDNPMYGDLQTEPMQGSSATDPTLPQASTVVPTSVQTDTIANVSVSHTENAFIGTGTTIEDQSALHPTPQQSPSSWAEPEKRNEPFEVSFTDPAPMPKPQPYYRRRYIDVPRWISFEDWIAGGGAEADYHYRP